ncbi:tRNA (guanosine(37)-N1)-methyltransferase TrmD [Luminiphilus sp.]|nr:tRNA (guanosine(37)-N1)-methyltransferase TrmD [Luminiphilus sp.]MDA7839844.1 tRNA (guanosine(37)-N1)-methyltransferase TrmD [Luminiphilus sp.]MDA9848247.1 tRNA (guanosine(37)-N1)-methyltransferase TrmD [Luminiphilus sp.]MDB2616777.1 tRNA (guanosine(37)-N1)-methyltransferase TrmD [Luminiphilus sp.]
MSELPHRFAVVTLFPEMFSAVSEWGVTSRGLRDQLWSLSLHDPRDQALDRHSTVDDRPYGGGPGMVMQAPLLERALESAKTALGGNPKVVAMTPQGRRFTDSVARELLADGATIFVSGRYEGIDERFIERSVDHEISVGDFVVSGGELPTMLVIDAMVRLIPGVLGHNASAQEDSFVDGLLDCPHYTRPEMYEGRVVPAVLLSGDHGAIARWRRAQSVRRTLDRRPDLLSPDGVLAEDWQLLKEWGLD